MRRILDILTSRRTSIALMAFIAVFGALGAWIPQASLGKDEASAIWQRDNPVVAGIADALGLYAIFSSWWFLTALAIFAFALAIATARMVTDAARVTRSDGRAPRTTLPGAGAAAVIERACDAGYRDRVVAGGRHVLTRNRLGVWAAAVLHVGMLISLVWAALLLGTTRGAIADFTQGEVRMPGDAYYAVEDPADPPELGVPWRFDAMRTETWPSGGLKEVAATLSFMDEGGTWEQRTCGVNQPLRIGGNTIYAQPTEFGDAALLCITDPDGAEQRIRVEFGSAVPGEAVYADGPYEVAGVDLDARWDPYGVRDAKALALRPAGKSDAAPVTLAAGETVSVAGLTVEFVGSVQWARFIVQRSPSEVPLFAGFAVIGLGSVMLYTWIPRELVVEATAEGVRYSWRAGRMSRAYLSERDAILGPGPGTGGSA